MTDLRYHILTLLKKHESGLTINEIVEQLSALRQYRNRQHLCAPLEVNIALSELDVSHWIFRETEDSPKFRVSGVGLYELKKERKDRMSFVLTWATFFLALASLVVSVVSLIFSI